MATANFAAIRQALPDARITLAMKPGRSKVVEGSEDFDAIVTDRSLGSPWALWRFARELRCQRFDLALLFSNSFRVALIASLAGIPRRVGYRRNGRSLLLTDPVGYERDGKKRRPIPMPLFYDKVCRQVGIAMDDPWPRLTVTEPCEKRAAEYRARFGIGDGEPLVGLNPGASFGASKLWPAEHFAETADALHRQHGLRSVILVGPGEEEIGRQIEARMETPVINTADDILPLDVLKAIVRDLKLLLSTDTGPRHYAVAFRTPVLTVMGPTDPRYSGINLDYSDVVRHDVPCGPCHLKQCPIDHKCMVEISPAEVLARVAELDRRLGIFA